MRFVRRFTACASSGTDRAWGAGPGCRPRVRSAPYARPMEAAVKFPFGDFTDCFFLKIFKNSNRYSGFTGTTTAPAPGPPCEPEGASSDGAGATGTEDGSVEADPGPSAGAEEAVPDPGWDWVVSAGPVYPSGIPSTVGVTVVACVVVSSGFNTTPLVLRWTTGLWPLYVVF